MGQRRAYRGAHRGDADDEEEKKFEIADTKRNIEEYVRVINKNTELFSTAEADAILETILNYIEDMGYDKYTVSKDKYKIKLHFITKEGEEGEMKIELLQAGENKVCIDFTKAEGDYLTFTKEFNAIRDYVGELADATY